MGRAAEQAMKLAVNASATARVVLLCGPGGVGSSDDEMQMLQLDAGLTEVFLVAGQHLYVTGTIRIYAVVPVLIAEKQQELLN